MDVDVLVTAYILEMAVKRKGKPVRRARRDHEFNRVRGFDPFD